MHLSTLCVIIGFFLISSSGSAQSTFSGKVTNQNGQGLNGATIVISKDSLSAILSYAISKNEGAFNLQLNSVADSLFVKISYVGYKIWEQTIPNKNQQLNVRLLPSSEELKEVVVESKIIEKHGDTLDYSVSAFKDQKDRVISDVLKKMPGIEISSSGLIEYQGKAIQKYYIEGLDLLEGRYNLANENLAADAVSKVQILENHQPIKLLDSLVFSERASLNIKLKKDVTVSGSAELGAGLSPLLWKAKLTPMLFTKKNQAIVTYQANNTGNNVSRAISDFSIADFGREQFDITKNDWLSIRQLAEPPFSSERWLDNNVHLGSVNYLVRLKNDLDLKTNISYLNDAQQQMGNTQTRFFTPTDTINILEKTNNELFINALRTKFTLERNTDENYLKNDLDINRFWNSQRGNIDTGNSQIRQNLSNPFFSIRNKLKLLKPIGKQLITFRSNTGYNEANQSLKVKPGQFEELLNKGNNYDKVEQAVQATTFFSDNTAGFTKIIEGITVSPEVGISVKKQSLSSQLKVSNADEIQKLNGDFANNLDFFSSGFYVTSRFFYKKGDWSINLNTPVSFRNFDIQDAALEENQNLNRITFEPDIFIKNEFAQFWETRIIANFSNNFGDVHRIYYGFILNNYRNLQRYNSPIPENFSQNYSWRLRFRNPLESLFAHFSYTYGRTKRNLVYSNQISQNAATVFEAIEQENYTNSHRLNLKGSKYFSKIHTTLDLGSSYSISNRQQLLNGELADVDNQILEFNIGLESEVTDWLSASYNGNFSLLKTSFAKRDFDEIKTQQHELDLFFYMSDNQYFSINSEYYFNNISEENRNNYFLNFNYQYTFKNTGIDLEASWNNVLNTEEFVQVSNSDYSYVQSTYRLRPSQVLLSLKFTF